MDILFVGKRSLHESVGVAQKLEGQMRAFEALGHTVWHTDVDAQGCWLYGKGKKIRLRGYRESLLRGLSPAWNHTRGLLEAARYTAQRFDLCYIRKPLCDAIFVKALRIFSCRGIPVVMEVPTYPYDDELLSQKTLPAWAFLAIDRLYRRRAGGYLHRIATFSQDAQIFGVPTIRLENAVDVGSFPVHRPGDAAAPFTLISVSSMYFWHGLDRLVRGAAIAARNGLAFRLHLVGDGPERETLRRMAADMGVEDAIIFHGEQTGPPLDRLFDGCHMAVSSLGSHRKNVFKSSELKNREYIARGIPLVYCCRDTALEPLQAYTCEVPQDESPLDLCAIASGFKDITSAEPDYPHSLRAYAEENLRWEKQMAHVLAGLTD